MKRKTEPVMRLTGALLSFCRTPPPTSTLAPLATTAPSRLTSLAVRDGRRAVAGIEGVVHELQVNLPLLMHSVRQEIFFGKQDPN
jgi:hypothetical protein